MNTVVKKPAVAKIRVKATRKGFYGFTRHPGDEFVIDEPMFSKHWMQTVTIAPEAKKAGTKGGA